MILDTRSADGAAGVRTPILTLEKVSMQFGGQAVLRNVNLSIAKGETLVVAAVRRCCSS